MLIPFSLALGVLGGFALDADGPPTREVVETVTAPRTDGPAPAPTTFSANYDARQVPLQQLVPRDAHVLSAWYADGHIVVAWDREYDDEGWRGGYRGLWLAVWRRSVGWRSVYRARYTGYDLTIRQVDLTHDGRADLFSRLETGGTAGCGVYRVIALARHVRQIYMREHCLDQGLVTADRGRLLEKDGLQHIGPGIHCCYRFTVTRVKRWDGRLWNIVSRRVRRNPLDA
jgi:hypothetical protein